MPAVSAAEVQLLLVQTTVLAIEGCWLIERMIWGVTKHQKLIGMR
jgi:hypothetical protein